MSSKVKELRGQVRIAVKELLPEVLIQEQYKELEKQVLARVDEIEKYTKKILHEMNERHKATMGMLVRSVSSPNE